MSSSRMKLFLSWGLTLCFAAGHAPLLHAAGAPPAADNAPAPAPIRAPQAQAPGADTPVRVLHDLAYGPDAKQRFDVYIPPKPSGPVLFMVHGGAWAFGDKASPDVVRNKVHYWSQRGLVVVSTNYRLLPKTKPLAQAQDVAKALGVAQQKAAEWGADPARFVLMGHSSGAHLVTLLNSAPELAVQAGAKPWRATVSIDSAALDVERLMSNPHSPLHDRAFGKDPADWRAASPFHALGPKVVPPLLFLCSKLRSDSCAQALAFERKASDFKHRIVIWEQFLNHRDINRTLGEPGEYTKAVDAWIRSVQ